MREVGSRCLHIVVDLRIKDSTAGSTFVAVSRDKLT
jgi:hypothetical protein